MIRSNGLINTVSKSKSKLRTHDARLGVIESKIIQPPSMPIPANAVDFARSINFEPDLWQAQVLNSDSKRLCICAARQTGKSATVALRALHTALISNALVLLLSPSVRQSQLLYQAVLRHYERAGRPLFKAETTLALSLRNGSQIIALPGSEQTIRGYASVSLLAVDESARVPDELYFSSLPFLAISEGTVILLSTPFGERGFFHSVFTGPADDEWERILIRASECSRISSAFLDEQREQMGPYWFDSEYNCMFLSPEGSMFSTDAIHKMFDDIQEYDI